MADLDQCARNSVALQREVFRLAEAEHGLSISVLARTRGLKLSAMPAWALGALRLPDDLVSLILSPFGKHVGTDEDGDGGCVDDLARETAGFTAEYMERAADGVICHIDKAALKKRARRLTPKARAVAA
jgi:hypothetical protein